MRLVEKRERVGIPKKEQIPKEEQRRSHLGASSPNGRTWVFFFRSCARAGGSMAMGEGGVHTRRCEPLLRCVSGRSPVSWFPRHKPPPYCPPSLLEESHYLSSEISPPLLILGKTKDYRCQVFPFTGRLICYNMKIFTWSRIYLLYWQDTANKNIVYWWSGWISVSSLHGLWGPMMLWGCEPDQPSVISVSPVLLIFFF